VPLEFGHPDFWTEVHFKFEPFFSIGLRLQQALNGLTDAAYPKPEKHHGTILNLGILSSVSMAEAMTLAGNGFGPGALKIVRCMLEYGINAEYLRRNPAACEAFLEWGNVEQWRFFHYLKDKAPEKYKNLDLAETDRRYDGSKGRFLRRAGKSALRDSWCSLNLRERADLTDFEEAYRLIYFQGSQLVHGTVGGLVMQSTLEDERRIAAPPSLQLCDQALTGAHLCVVRMVDTLCRTFDVESKPSYTELLDEFHTTWAKLTAE
jgi:hypothetical protein